MVSWERELNIAVILSASKLGNGFCTTLHHRVYVILTRAFKPSCSLLALTVPNIFLFWLAIMRQSGPGLQKHEMLTSDTFFFRPYITLSIGTLSHSLFCSLYQQDGSFCGNPGSNFIIRSVYNNGLEVYQCGWSLF